MSILPPYIETLSVSNGKTLINHSFSYGDSFKKQLYQVEESFKYDFENIIGCELIEKNGIIPFYFVEKISLKGSIWGKLEVRKRCVHFASQNNGKRPDYEDKYKFGTKADDFLETKSKRKIWKLCDIQKIHTRSFNLRDCALEFFTIESKTYFFNLFTVEKRNEILILLKKSNPNINVIKNRRKAFLLSGLQEKWIKNEISNFEYLMELNTYAGN